MKELYPSARTTVWQYLSALGRSLGLVPNSETNSRNGAIEISDPRLNNVSKLGYLIDFAAPLAMSTHPQTRSERSSCTRFVLEGLRSRGRGVPDLVGGGGHNPAGPLRRRPHMIGTQVQSRTSIYAGFEAVLLMGKSVTTSPESPHHHKLIESGLTLPARAACGR